MQTDPIGFAGGMNLYAYVGNDPLNFVDPLGLEGLAQGCYYQTEDAVYLITAPDGSTDFGGAQVGYYDCRLANAPNAFGLGFQWATGTGPDFWIFNEDNEVTQELMDAPGVANARCYFYSVHGPNPEDRTLMDDVIAPFNVSDYARARTATQHFVGGYSVSIYIRGGRANFSAFNRSSVRSLLGGSQLPDNMQPPEWERDEGLFGNTYQLYTWSEDVPDGSGCPQ